MTKARQMVNGSLYDPETVKMLDGAFDSVWEEIAGNFSSPLAREAARLKLANVVLSLAAEGERDAERLKQRAVGTMSVDGV
jgi:hypothetical protein